MSGKAKAIIAHLTIIGWIIALILNAQNKDELASYYIRQYLGIVLMGLIGGWAFGLISGTLSWIWSALILIAWILSLIGAISGEKSETPVVGVYFQDWFKGL